MKKYCIKCNSELIIGINICKSRFKDHWFICHECWKNYMKKYRNSHPKFREQQNLSNIKRGNKLRLEVLKHYSPELKCNRCGFSDIRCLDINHINPETKIKNQNGKILVYYLKKNNYPKEFEVLCRNCNWIKYLEFIKASNLNKNYL